MYGVDTSKNLAFSFQYDLPTANPHLLLFWKGEATSDVNLASVDAPTKVEKFVSNAVKVCVDMEEFRSILETLVQLIKSKNFKEAQALFEEVMTFEQWIEEHQRQVRILSMYIKLFYLYHTHGALHHVHIQLKSLKNSGGALDAGPQYRALLKEVDAEFTRLFAELQ